MNPAIPAMGVGLGGIIALEPLFLIIEDAPILPDLQRRTNNPNSSPHISLATLDITKTITMAGLDQEIAIIKTTFNIIESLKLGKNKAIIQTPTNVTIDPKS